MKYLAKLYFLDFQFNLERNRVLYDIIFLSLYLYLYILQLQITIILCYVVASLYAIVFFYSLKIPKLVFQICSIFLAFFLLPVINFNHGITPLFHLIFLPVLLLVAINFSKKNLVELYQTFRAFQFQNIFLITLGLIYNYDDLDPLSSIIPWVSRNGITSVLIVCQIVFCFISYLYNKKIPLLSLVLVVILCFYGLGRGSIIVSILLLLFGAILNVINSKSIKVKIFALIFISGLIVYFSYNSETIIMLENIEEGLNKTQFGQGYTDEARLGMNAEYISNLDTWNFFFGSSYKNTAIEKYFGGNPHNSFIRLHSYYGIFGIMVLLMVTVSILIAKKEKSIKFTMLVLLLLLLFRAYTEPILFPSALDLFFFFMIALYFRKNYFIPNDKILNINSHVI
jgi:hypothetical protein